MSELDKNYWNEKVSKQGEYPEYTNAGGRHQVVKAIEIIISHLPRGKKVLDVGCGSGFSTYAYYPYCTELYGVDYSAQAISQAKEKYPHIKFVEADIEKLPFKDNEFDVVICQGVLHHLIKTASGEDLTWKLRKALKEIDRVSKGLLLISEVNALNPLRKYKEKTYYPKIKRNEQSYTFGRWEKIFRRLGYKVKYHRYNTFIPNNVSQKGVDFLSPFEGFLEMIPLVKYLAGSVFFVCKKRDKFK